MGFVRYLLGVTAICAVCVLIFAVLIIAAGMTFSGDTVEWWPRPLGVFILGAFFIAVCYVFYRSGKEQS